MDIGVRIKQYRERQGITQEELALKVFVSRQTISNWETNKSCPDIKSLIALSNIFNVSLDDFIKGDIVEMRKMVDDDKIKKFNVLSFIFFAELLFLAISAYPLSEIYGFIGIIIWILFFIIFFVNAYFIERFKKDNDIQTYKEILAFIDGKQLSYEELQQEKGKRMYQKILYAFFAGVFSLITSLLVIFIMNKI